MSWAGLQCVIVVYPDHTHLLFSRMCAENPSEGSVASVQVCILSAEPLLVVPNLNSSHDVESDIKIMPCIRIDKPLLVYRLSGNVNKSKFSH